MRDQMKYLIWIPYALGALPLSLYFGIMIAIISGFGGPEPSPPRPALARYAHTAVFYIFGLYPIVYIGCLLLSMRRSKEDRAKPAILISLIPLGWLLVVAALVTAMTL